MINANPNSAPCFSVVNKSEEVGLNPTQRSIAAISVICRLSDPSSENALQTWMNQTALPEIVAHTALGKGDDRFYRVSDALLRQATLFDLDQSILLYDLTNSHFERAERLATMAIVYDIVECRGGVPFPEERSEVALL